MLPPGTVVPEWKIVRTDSAADDAYQVHFRLHGREYSCPLYAFQPRTASVAGGAEAAVAL